MFCSREGSSGGTCGLKGEMEKMRGVESEWLDLGKEKKLDIEEGGRLIK